MKDKNLELLKCTFTEILESGGQCEGMDLITEILDKHPEYVNYFISIFDKSDPTNNLVRTKASAIILDYTFYKPAYDHLVTGANWTKEYFEEYKPVQEYLKKLEKDD